MIAIVLGTDTPIGLSVVRELGRHGVEVHAVGRSLRSIGAASRFAAHNHMRPAGALAAWLPSLIAETGAKGLLAVSEGDLIDLAPLPDVIDGCAILTPRAAPLAAVLDKAATLRHAAGLGIAVPSCWQPGVSEEFAERSRTLAYPVVLKWADPAAAMPALEAQGEAFRKAEFALGAAALLAALDRYTPMGQWPLVQSYCPGFGLGQMIHMDDGQATLRFQHRRLHEWPPEGGVSTLCEALPLTAHSPQMAQSEALLRAIGWAGPAMVEYRYDPATATYWLMEINGRFWGSLPLATACGAEFAWEAFRRGVLGETAPPPAPHDGLRARYMIPETRRLLRILFSPSAVRDPMFRVQRLRDMIGYVAGFFDLRMRYYVFRLDDPGPLLRDIANIIRKVLRRG